jgi:hypothetical protein
MKKSIGRMDLEHALKRLDKLTLEEAQMATSQVLKATHAIDDRVKGITDQVVDVDDRVAGVDERVRAVDDKVAEVVQYILGPSPRKTLFHPDRLRWKGNTDSRTANGRRHRPDETFVIS